MYIQILFSGGERVKVAGFDWDAGNWPKCGKHGVGKEDIEGLFKGVVTIIPAPQSTRDEVRYIAIGTSPNGRDVLVVFTFRKRMESGLLVRPISARYMHKKERRHLEKEIARSQNRSGS